MYAVSHTGPVFVPGMAGERLKAKTVQRHVWAATWEAAGMWCCDGWFADVLLQAPGSNQGRKEGGT